MPAQRHPPALTFQELEDLLGCRDPKRERPPVMISSQCHPGAPVRVAFDVEGGSLWIHCHCGTLITNVMIAKAPVH